MSMIVARSLSDLRDVVDLWRGESLSTAVVPTMGALHEGHIRLIAEAKEKAERVMATIFVNPKQFAANEDLSRYPRDEEGDLAKLEDAGCDLAYLPNADEIYPPSFVTTITLGGPAKAGLEDKFRPQFFDGVATVVAKLFIHTAADFAIFGEKDYQQLLVVTQMARDLDLGTEVIGIPTVREDDGLAKSSRNRYLSKHERHQATAIYRTLEQAADKIRAGGDPQVATKAASRSLMTLGFEVDYVTARNAETLAVPTRNDEPLRLLAAARIGKTRLIDNIPV
ncbi:pantoate--beta-alanine ligase [Aestuariivirga sp.]|uniref:pantoate--beta-alanine ligase n=1 Tax=Aestuariivirga sp. TaxID=2650926 RepID=UPI0039E2C102